MPWYVVRREHGFFKTPSRKRPHVDLANLVVVGETHDLVVLGKADGRKGDALFVKMPKDVFDKKTMLRNLTLYATLKGGCTVWVPWIPEVPEAEDQNGAEIEAGTWTPALYVEHSLDWESWTAGLCKKECLQPDYQNRSFNSEVGGSQVDRSETHQKGNLGVDNSADMCEPWMYKHLNTWKHSAQGEGDKVQPTISQARAWFVVMSFLAAAALRPSVQQFWDNNTLDRLSLWYAELSLGVEVVRNIKRLKRKQQDHKRSRKKNTKEEMKSGHNLITGVARCVQGIAKWGLGTRTFDTIRSCLGGCSPLGFDNQRPGVRSNGISDDARLHFDPISFQGEHECPVTLDDLEATPFLADPGINTHAIYAGGIPTWDSTRSTMLRPNATVGERLTFMARTHGWLSTDEWAHAISRIRRPNSPYHILSIAHYVPTQDDFMFEHENQHVPNTGITLIPVMFGSHWIGIEIDRQHVVPQIDILQAPPEAQTRIEHFVCRVMQQPSHRMNINHGMDRTPPNMCGWNLLYRWIMLTHSQNSFHDVHARMFTLADVNRRIILRIMQTSIRDWERTGDTEELQQVAHTIRLSFLTNLLQFDTGVHTTIDSHAITAVGHPPGAFQQDNHPTMQASQMPAGHAEAASSSQTAQSVVPEINIEENGQPEQADEMNHLAHVGVQTDMSFVLEQSQMFSRIPSIPVHVCRRLQEMTINPQKAASDELDVILDRYRPHISEVQLFPCCSWDRRMNTIATTSGRDAMFDNTKGGKIMIVCLDHWFVADIRLIQDSYYTCIFGFPLAEHHEVTRFVHALANFLRVPAERLRMSTIDHECPWHMCGYKMLFDLLGTCNIGHMHQPAEEIMVLTQFQHEQMIHYIVNHAFGFWSQITGDIQLLQFAFDTKISFLADLLQTQTVMTYQVGGGILPEWTPDQRLPALSERAEEAIMSHLRNYVPVTGLCHCSTKAFTAQVILKQYVQAWNDLALVSCRIVNPTTALPEQLGHLSCTRPVCHHNKDSFAHVAMQKEVWSSLGPGTHAFITEARVLWIDGKGIIDMRPPQAGIIPTRFQPPQAGDTIRIGELYAGGFSGWSFGVRKLQESLLPVKMSFSVEHDALAARAHASNHSRHPIVESIAQGFGLEGNNTIPNEHVTFLANVEHTWWHCLTPSIQVLLASPPCQPWSQAGTAKGLETLDGRLLLQTVVKCVYLRPAILCMEEVATLPTHPHFSWFRAVLHWAGYKIVWAECSDLKDVLPHSRKRLLLVAVRMNDDRISEVQPETWSTVNLDATLRSILLPTADISHSLSPPITEEVLHAYLALRYLPKGVGTTPHEIRRYRIRTDKDSHPCIMANYTRSHLLPQHILQEGGLLGSFILHEGKLRWMSIAEVVMMFGCGHACKMPVDSQVSYHLLGNAISVPQAVLCILNGLAQLTTVSWNKVPVWLVHETLTERLQSHNVTTSIQGKHLVIEPLVVSPTEDWDENDCCFRTLRIPSNNQLWDIRMTPKVPVVNALRQAFYLQPNANILWKPVQSAKAVIPLLLDDVMPMEGMDVQEFFLGPIYLEEKRFLHARHPIIVVLSVWGMFVASRQEVETVQDLRQALIPHTRKNIECTTHMGNHLEDGATPPDLLFVMAPSRNQQPDMQSLLETPWTLTTVDLCLHTQMHTALSILQAYTQLGWNGAIRALGWKTVLDTSPGGMLHAASTVSINMVPCQDVPKATLQDLVNLLTTMNDRLGQNAEGIQVKVKLWDTYVWSGLVSADTPSGFAAEAWERAVRHFGQEAHLRTIIHGKRTNPEWEMKHYIQQTHVDKVIHIHLVRELHGGGSKAEATQKAKDEFAARAMQIGFDAMDTKAFTTQLYQEVGAARMRQLMAIRDDEGFAAQCIQVAKQARIRLPERHDLDEERNKRVRTMWKAKSEPNAHLLATDMSIGDDTFCQASGEPLIMQTAPDPKADGVVFIAADAPEFFSQIETTPAYMMMIVPGNSCPLQIKQCQKHNIPVQIRSQGKAIIAACCHSLGDSQVRLQTSGGDQAQVTNTVNTMFVAWKEECDSEVWENLIQAPIHTLFDQLQVLPGDTITGPPQGRSWRANKQPADPYHAESFCFYARVVEALLHPLLQKSGRKGIYLTPKSEHSSLADARYAIVWTDCKTAKEAVDKADKIDITLGVVRSQKEKPTYGIRTTTKEFTNLWTTLRPTEPVPKSIHGEHVYRLSPVPQGATQDDIQKWLDLEKIEAKPLRALNNHTWLLVGPAAIDKTNLTWRKNSVLIQPVQSRYQRANTIVLAGKVAPVSTSRTWKSSHMPMTEVDPFLFSDPWKSDHKDPWSKPNLWSTYQPSLTGSTSSSSRATTKTQSETSTEKNQEIENIKTKMAALEEVVNTQRKETTAWRRDVHTEFQQVRKEMTTQISDVKESFQSTLTAALTQTQESLKSSFRDDFQQLKALLGGGTSRKRQERDDDDMQD